MFVIEDNSLPTKSLIRKYKLRLLPASDFDTQEIKRLKKEKVPDILNKYTFHHNQLEIYRKAFLPINNKQGLSSRLSFKESDEMKYYYAKAKRLEEEDPEMEQTAPEQDKFSKKETELKVRFPEYL